MSVVPRDLREHPLTFLEAWRGHGAWRGVCRRVVDGDTFDVLIDQGMRRYPFERLRLAGIDTPEIYGVSRDSEEYAAGAAVKSKVEERILDRPVLVRTLDEETFGRWVAEVDWLDAERGEWRSLGGWLAGLGHRSEG